MSTNVHDKAHELASSLRESDEFQQLKGFHEQVENDEVAKRMLDNFRQLQLDLQQKQMQGEQPSEEEISQAQKQFEMVQQHEVISKLMEQEQKMSTVIGDLNKIITEPLEELYGNPDDQ
ncbi:YlbF family regulator [Salsuginibacillus kocurii]|uniref:YlbF family regulator n=1 Tax=Salsuginibacillus kocurii TaxID=427078 RepID=UPI00035C5582|nr:YlbF family regulator [Salsuginibacillus kocurii]